MMKVSVVETVSAGDVARRTAGDVRKVLKSELVRVAGAARGRVQSKGIRASGALARSMQGGADLQHEALVTGWIGGQPYWPYVETGTRPHTPPLDPLIKWVRSKKLLVSTRRNQMRTLTAGLSSGAARTVRADQVMIDFAYSVARSIGEKRGGKPPPVAAIIAWMQYKWIKPTTTQAIRIIARSVQRAIAKRGTKAQPFVEPSLAAEWARLIDAIMGATAAAAPSSGVL